MKNNKSRLHSNIKELMDSYDRWKTIYEEGCNDPFWQDGTNLTLVRSHIKYYKKNIEKELGSKFVLYPDHFFYPLPMIVDYTFMSKDRELKGEICKKTKTLPYSEAVKFNWEDDAFDSVV